MSFLKSFFSKKEEPINSYSDFWVSFQKNEAQFHKVLKQQGNITKDFFDIIAPKLDQIKEGIWYLAGMCDENTAELILTADGNIKNIVFVEELVESAPKMKNWKITALKQPSESNYFGIEMDGYKFDINKMKFYSIDHGTMPDEIDITITHQDYTKENSTTITTGVYHALDNSLGELNSVTTVDQVNIINPKHATKELVPIEKLKDFLIWREKEFVEKYEGTRHNTESDSYSGLEGTRDNGLPMFAIINKDLLNWDSKASHPWIATMKIKYDGSNNNGMPNKKTYQILDQIEENIMADLKDYDGYLNIGRQTADSVREIYFACFDFRKPAKVFYKIQKKYQDRFELDYDIYKDKYWQSFDHFMPN